MKRFVFALLIVFLATACSTDDANPDNPTTKGVYNIYITGDRTGTYENGEITLWNPGSYGDIIVLGSEKVGQSIGEKDPIAALTLQFLNNGSNSKQQDIQKISLSTKEVSTGTTDEKDERLFEYDGISEASQCGFAGEASVVIQQTGADFIKGTFCFQMERRTLVSGDLPETVTVHGDFTAVR